MWVKRNISAAILYTLCWQNGAWEMSGRRIMQDELLVESWSMDDEGLNLLRYYVVGIA
jgi:hypothetical protein